MVIEGALSGSVELSSFLKFTGLMQAIHLPIGIVEGLVTGAVIVAAKFMDTKKFSAAAGGISLILAGGISNYASQKPDGLEWSLLNIPVVEQTQNALYGISEAVQAKTAVLANLPYTSGSILGLLLVCGLMYLTGLLICRKMIRENAE